MMANFDHMFMHYKTNVEIMLDRKRRNCVRNSSRPSPMRRDQLFQTLRHQTCQEDVVDPKHIVFKIAPVLVVNKIRKA